MSDFLNNGLFPSIDASTLNDVTAEERSSAIDFVNRNNFVFEEFNVDKVMSTFLPEAAVHHIGGTFRGEAERRKFLETFYAKIFIPGISRNAMNHVVDRDGDGVMVRYQMHLVRYAWPSDIRGIAAGEDLLSNDGLPSTWYFGAVIDRLRMTSEGWKLFERYLGPAFRDKRLEISNDPKALKELPV
ncbi:uncharacterized protein TRIVIDRAFT_220595 [Trichoderma virens Gv29-8]|uniref:SnoaL-like domain-containing protein n=1 Tax=Hypocrea virens (strain Gv29-8 / FGSC 10586) TaxID=413071 RepID=G9MN30_HYPVG|nr:uncharacterized protein TRIVIDRAFT_220595 [Trichoderma virens Gv29-8]EHK23322.1 hypothetical protein TRIVIDRAFT_220595 [Trichoderma virens Gv29-8]